MTVYLIAFIATLIAAYLNNRMAPKVRLSVLIVILIYLILIVGLRYKVGVDTISYMHAQRKILPIDEFFSIKGLTSTRYEPGYAFVCSVVKTFTNKFWPVQIIMATITNGSIFYFLYRYCKGNVFIGVLLYLVFQFLYFSMEIMRESAAVGFFLLNFKNLQEKKWLNYYLLSIPSILFHYSAIIIWFFPIIKLLRNNIFFIITCIVFIGIAPLVEKLNEILHIAAIAGRIDQYASGADDLNLNWRLAELIRTAFPAIATLIGYRIAKSECEFSDFLRLQIIFCMGAFAIPLIFSRFANYSTVIVTVAAANLLSIKSIRGYLKIVFVCFLLLTQVNFYRVNYQRWVPYVSIFHPENLPIRQSLYRETFTPWLRYIK